MATACMPLLSAANSTDAFAIEVTRRSITRTTAGGRADAARVNESGCHVDGDRNTAQCWGVPGAGCAPMQSTMRDGSTRTSNEREVVELQKESENKNKSVINCDTHKALMQETKWRWSANL